MVEEAGRRGRGWRWGGVARRRGDEERDRGGRDTTGFAVYTVALHSLRGGRHQLSTPLFVVKSIHSPHADNQFPEGGISVCMCC